ncbi:MAG: hypothetical protein UR96_C0006G0009 [candidate division WS6 bacterium GW2011_GWC1_36_11]|uniref:tRNA nuclease CdiA C-terminal domain-containing protein n=2 Tax=Candidatus Dojkabacteria TaxID=74243 RepID=A0A0G0DH39_9BACT|nr:MAG: hypothetical protein UR96_C0006G0009 [candidate division WS6 bacterium GW2011_GWC1_36_11]KKQ04622.1 MAG: hypothetical protein US14_C0004G0014 [candidate division WS6 bacterium GW2011_WS6_36_26]KKQ11118.1 MAG: hypothetical protein US24_C0041G0004 [candidate division WS6 bacterium GW2011_GWC2_36_7]HAM37392.1 hypothetical protein [Patescibacteria group bacterium]HAM96416.1 hypothetical protein [Patescibacteria group bacterium]
MKKGIITKEIGASPNYDENKAGDYFANLGYDIFFLTISKTLHHTSPDIEMCDKKWEIKTPKGNGKYTIEHLIQHASKQSKYIIIDLRQCKMSESKALSKIQTESSLRKVIKTVLVITKSKNLLILKGKFGNMKA